MNSKFFMCAALLLAGSTLYAQDYSFKVFGSKGNNTVNGVPVKVGTKLKDSEAISVDGAYVGLSHANGKTVELTAKGTYKIKDLMTQALKNSNSSLTSKYASFVVNELTKDDGDAPTQNRSKYMNKTGSVDRGTDQVVMIPLGVEDANNAQDLNREAIPVKIYGNTIGVKWVLKPGVDEKKFEGYRVLLLDLSEQVIAAQTVKTFSTVVQIPETAFKEHSHLILKAIPLEQGQNLSDEKLNGSEKGVSLEKVSEEKAAQITADLKSICVNPDETINKLIAARYFEDNGLFMDAIAMYEDVVKANPNEPKYAKLYNDFLVANKLTKEDIQQAFASTSSK
jgi:hypothetical protein